MNYETFRVTDICHKDTHLIGVIISLAESLRNPVALFIFKGFPCLYNSENCLTQDIDKESHSKTTSE